MPDAAGLLERIGRFAREQVRPRQGLGSPGPFPDDLWTIMARERLLAFGVPEAFGGVGVPLLQQAEAADALAREGRNLGLAVAWQSHNTLSRFFFAGFGSPEQKAKWLPELAAGRITPAVAISEPGAGAHPKHLKTEAVPDGDAFRLSGEKAYVTNGPIAGVFIVVAVSAIEAGRKRFTAFLVEKGIPGLSFTQAGHVEGLYPVGHCGLRLDGCRVGREAIFGEPGSAYERMAQPLRDHEDMLGLGTLTGGMGAILDLFRDAPFGDAAPDDATRETVGRMIAIRAAVAELGRSILSDAVAEPQRGTLLLAARNLVQDYLRELDPLVAAAGGELPPPADLLGRDLRILAGVARQVVSLRLRRLGDSVLSPPG